MKRYFNGLVIIRDGNSVTCPRCGNIGVSQYTSMRRQTKRPNGDVTVRHIYLYNCDVCNIVFEVKFANIFDLLIGKMPPDNPDGTL